MIQIPRSLARQLRTILRKASVSRGPNPLLELCSNNGELTIRAQLDEAAIEHRLPSPSPNNTIFLPNEALADLQGRTDSPVTLEKTGKGQMQATWFEGSIPQSKTYTFTEPSMRPTYPEAPETLQPLDRGFLLALEQAVESAGGHNRFATDKIQLRGTKGSIVGTDGRQVLIQSGFAFPWSEDFLIPALALFGCRELPQEDQIFVGKGAKHLTLRIGTWSIHLNIDLESRFPNVDAVLPKTTAQSTTWRLSPADAHFLAGNLARLPGQENSDLPVTLDLNGHVALRAKGENQLQPTEIVLNGSEITGKAVRLLTNREYLGRAISLGFSEFQIAGDELPMVCREKNRIFGWAPLPKAGALPPSDNAIRITSGEGTKFNGQDVKPKPVAEARPQAQPQQEASAKPPEERKKRTTSPPQVNGHTYGVSSHASDTNRSSSASIIALTSEAQALKEVMRDVFKRSSRLVASLKRHRKQTKVFASTLASLRQLQQIDA